MKRALPLKQYPALKSFLSQHKSATVAVPIDDNGTLHAAALLYWHDERTLEFYFVTSSETEKMTLLNKRQSLAAACVVGTEAGTPFTLQMRGKLSIMDEAPKKVLEEYYTKRGDRDDINEPRNVLVRFTPEWARFKDYSKGYDPYYLELLGRNEQNGDLMEAKLYTDGGSRGNPGPSAGAFVISKMDDNVVEKSGFLIGVTTNNQAEYQALLQGLQRCVELGIRKLNVFMDSELIVKQLNGVYKIKNKELKPHYLAVKKLQGKFEKISFNHVPRAVNKEADTEVNRILDQQAT